MRTPEEHNIVTFIFDRRDDARLELDRWQKLVDELAKTNSVHEAEPIISFEAAKGSELSVSPWFTLKRILNKRAARIIEKENKRKAAREEELAKLEAKLDKDIRDGEDTE